MAVEDYIIKEGFITPPWLMLQHLRAWKADCLFPSTKRVCCGHQEDFGSNPGRKLLNVPELLWKRLHTRGPAARGALERRPPGTHRKDDTASLRHTLRSELLALSGLS